MEKLQSNMIIAMHLMTHGSNFLFCFCYSVRLGLMILHFCRQQTKAHQLSKALPITGWSQARWSVYVSSWLQASGSLESCHLPLQLRNLTDTT